MIPTKRSQLEPSREQQEADMQAKYTCIDIDNWIKEVMP